MSYGHEQIYLSVQFANAADSKGEPSLVYDLDIITAAEDDK
ncbi:MAG TPA: hypothetical protein VE223_03925 [Nitrososphaeraceae archaeon]|nr:hypothetical protein [Nitrososphaeraceae archaeon]